MSKYIKLTENQAKRLLTAVSFAGTISASQRLKDKFGKLYFLLRKKLSFVS